MSSSTKTQRLAREALHLLKGHIPIGSRVQHKNYPKRLGYVWSIVEWAGQRIVLDRVRQVTSAPIDCHISYKIIWDTKPEPPWDNDTEYGDDVILLRELPK